LCFALLLCAASLGAASSDDPTRALDARVSLKANALDLGDFVARLRQRSGVPLVVDRGVVEERVTARLRDRSLKEIFAGLKGLFGYVLRYDKPSETFFVIEGEHLRRAGELRARERAAFQSRLREFRRALAKDPKLRAELTLPLRALLDVPDGALNSLDQHPLEIPFSQLAPDAQAAAREYMAARRGGRTLETMRGPTDQEIQQSKVIVRVMGEGTRRDLVVLYKTATDMSGPVVLSSRRSLEELRRNGGQMDGSGLSTRRTGPGEQPFSLKDYDPGYTPQNPRGAAGLPALAPRDPELERRVSLSIKPQLPLSSYTGAPWEPLAPLDEVYQGVAEQADLDFLADSYPAQESVRAWDTEEMPLAKALGEVAQTAGCGLSKSGGLYLFRSNTWIDDYPNLVSAALTRKWLRFWAVRFDAVTRPVDVWELAGMAALVRPESLRQLEIHFRWARGASSANFALALFARLSEEQRKQMLSEEGLALESLPPELRRVPLDRLMEAQRRTWEPLLKEPGQRLRIRVSQNSFAAECRRNGGWTTFQTVPRPTPLQDGPFWPTRGPTPGPRF
jgi:hypothetical protein